MTGRHLRSSMPAARMRGEAGFSMVEAVIAIVILAVIGFALHRATLSALRYMQMGKARVAQARLLEHAIDWSRAETCFLMSELGQKPVYEHELYDGTKARINLRGNVSGDPPTVRTVEIELPPGDSRPGVKQSLLLDVALCR